MSEVHRYKVVKMLSEDGNRISYDPHGPEVVLASAFEEATRLFLDAAEHAVASERREKELQQRLTSADEALDKAADDYALLSLEAGQRMELLEGLLLQTNELLYEIQGDPGAVPSSSIDALRGEVFTALKQADGQALTTCSWQYGAFSWHTSCGQEWMLSDGTPEQNGMRFCHSCGKTLAVEGEGDDA